ncbi:hypothetical protein DXG01_005690 [Tephrocybe rancida]|nr:hypothetical protein DXG01_005690 [Tephrocybe rancida]
MLIIGAGLVWDDVYTALEPHGVTVVGGRVSGVGVAGFMLGGGYSFLTNQHGLTIDTVTAFELVKPSGVVATVTRLSDPLLFSGLKGGIVNFVGPQIPDVSSATALFSSSVTDPKASTILAYNFALGQPGITQLLFYDGPMPPAGIFDAFLDIPLITKDVATRSMSSFISLSLTNGTSFQQAIFNSVSLIQYTPTILDAILNETLFWGNRLSPLSAFLVSYDVEPFLPSLFTHTTKSSSAYPPSRTRGLSPFNIYYAWVLDSFDDTFHEAVKQSAAHIEAVANAEGQDVAGLPLYPNYAIFDTPLEDLYGHNVWALQTLKAFVDPTNIMGLAGGFKL